MVVLAGGRGGGGRRRRRRLLRHARTASCRRRWAAMGRQAALILLLACNPAPPYGEVLVEADVEQSVPKFLSRLRIDLYAPDGTWYQSRDISAPDVSEWPI